jgi:hypothetical protein
VNQPDLSHDLPTEFYLEFLGRTIAIHWDNHAWLMFSTWFILVPLALLAVRFGKPTPTLYGIPKGTPLFSHKLWWWALHRSGLYVAIGLSLVGGAVAMIVSGGFSGSLHSYMGAGAIVLGCLQVISSWFRGSSGGMHGAGSLPDDPATWRGDHYDMTPRRKWFEAYHKTAGYFAVVLAFGAVTTGLTQFWLPGIALALALIVVAALVLAVVFERLGKRHDTYHSVYGTHADHPYNSAEDRTAANGKT